MGDNKSALFSVTPGLHTRPDLICVPNICLGWHRHTQTHRPHYGHNGGRAASLSSNLITCIIHQYFNLWSIIKQMMPTLLQPGNGVGSGGWKMTERGGHVYVRRYEFTSESRPQPCVTEQGKSRMSSVPSSACCFNRLLLREILLHMFVKLLCVRRGI